MSVPQGEPRPPGARATWPAGVRHPYQPEVSSALADDDFAYVPGGECAQAFGEGGDIEWVISPAGTHRSTSLLLFYLFEILSGEDRQELLDEIIEHLGGVLPEGYGTHYDVAGCALASRPVHEQMAALDRAYAVAEELTGVDVAGHLVAYARLRGEYASPLLRAVLDDVARAPREGRRASHLIDNFKLLGTERLKTGRERLHERLGLPGTDGLDEILGLLDDALGAFAEETGCATEEEILSIYEEEDGEILFCLSFSAQWALRQLV